MRFAKEEDQFLIDNHKSIPAKRMAKMLGRTEGTARQRMKVLGITVPPEIVEKFRKDSQIKKGNVPINKGKKQSSYMSPEKIEKTKATRFKKGHIPKNAKEDGIITIRTDTKSKIKYQYIRLALGKWQELHRYNWVKKNGPIPEGMIIAFKDRNSLNADIENLEMITLEENMRRNTIHQYTPEIQTALKVLNKVKRKIKLHEKQINRSK
jgi:hypothetical protein